MILTVITDKIVYRKHLSVMIGVINMIKRDLYMNRIRPFINKNLVKVITGIRRSGKSIMLELIKGELLEQGVSANNIFSYNFESMANAHLCTPQALYSELNDRIKNIDSKVYLFFDEIQEVTDWEKVINSCRVDFDCDIYITGSNAKLLSGELATYLAGRYVEFAIYPFSFKEFMQMYRSKYPQITDGEAFKKYIQYGGMPYLGELDYQDTSSIQYLQDLYNSVELKDIVKRNKIRDIDLLERIMVYVMANIGNTFSASSISKYFKSEGRNVSAETILNYIHSCMDAFLFYSVKRQDLVGKKLLSVHEKYYLADHGIRQAVLGSNTQDIALVLENIVFLELIRRGYEVTVGKINNKEVDFIAKTQQGLIYVQVCYLLASPETIEREFGVYENIRDNYPKYVLSMDEFDMSRNGIKHKNIRDFLLSNPD